MIYLLLSIFCFSAIIIIFRHFKRYNVNTFQTIVINYISASAFGFILAGRAADPSVIIRAPWFPNAFIIGLIFIFLFYVIAKTAQQLGVSVSAVANKMSLVIPVGAAFYLYDDSVTFIKITGIFLALAGVFLTSIKKDLKMKDWSLFLLPVILFFGSGLLDTYIKYTQETLITSENMDFFIPTAFSVAAVCGGLTVLFRFFVKPSRFQTSSFFWGLIIGILNYSSLFFLLKTLEIDDAESSVVFPLNNVGIVLVATLASVFIFKEKLSRVNWLGIIFGIVAIILMSVA